MSHSDQTNITKGTTTMRVRSYPSEVVTASSVRTAPRAETDARVDIM